MAPDPLTTFASLEFLPTGQDVEPRITRGRQLELRDLALDHIQQGVCVFDRQHRLLLFNRRYAELYRIDPAQLRIGMTLRDIIDMRYALGTGPDMPPGQYAAWRERVFDYNRVIDTEVTLRDGRVLAIHHEPAATGGWVACHDDITDRRRAEAHIHHMAHHDALTGLANRVHFIDTLEKTLSRLRGSNPRDHRPCPDAGSALAVLFLDLDHFKDVNDTLGHAAGDELLRLAGGRIAASLSTPDVVAAPETTVVARLGGDEFAILLDGVPDPGTAALVARSVIDALDAPFGLDTQEARIGVSIGIAICTSNDPDLTPALLLSQADMALYRAKTTSRGGFQFFDPAMATTLQRRVEGERELRQALADNGLDVHYQPQIDLRTGRIIGVEALARWPHPTRGMIPPSEFIPIAEHAVLICALGDWVLRTACARAVAWGVRLAVNLFPGQIRNPNLVGMVKSALADTGLAPRLLEFEITETVLLHDSAHTLERLHQLRDLGIGIALDDFGTGYSSLSYLNRFPFTKLKIDRTFVANLVQDPTAAAIVQAIATLGRSLAIRVTAEGVETEAQLECLRAMGCDEVQGYLPGRPATPDVIDRLIADQRSP